MLHASQSHYNLANNTYQQQAITRRRRGFTVPTCPDNGQHLFTTTTRLYDNRSHVLGEDPINEDDGDKEIQCSKEHHHHHHHPMQQQFDYQHNESACTSSRQDTKKVVTTTTASYGRQSVLSSLSDDVLPWERGATPPYGIFDHPPAGKSPAVESTSSGDSGYAKSYHNSLSGRGTRATTPEHLVSLFDPPSSSSSPINTNTTTTDASIQNTTATSGSTRSKLSRFSSLSFAKKLPIRQKIPFHMRYQEWTDLKLKKRRPASLIVAEDEPPLSPNSLPQSPTSTTTFYEIPKSPAPSTSSPISLFGTNNINSSSHVARLASHDHNALPPLDTQHMAANLDAWGDPSPGSVRNGTVPRRKSTGTLEVNASFIRPDSNDNGERLEMQQPNGNITARYVCSLNVKELYNRR